MTLLEFRELGAWLGFFVDEFRGAAGRAIAAGRSALSLCLAGGSTPEPIYRAIAGLADPGIRVEIWLGDERAVPPGAPERNGRMVERAFGAAAWSPRLRLWPDLPDPGSAAASYASQLEAALGSRPSFDLVILGLGSDGHTASLFPGSAALGEAAALACASRSPLPPRDRMTLCYPAFSGARRTVFAVRGEAKRAIVARLAAEDAALPATAAGGADRIIAYLAD